MRIVGVVTGVSTWALLAVLGIGPVRAADEPARRKTIDEMLQAKAPKILCALHAKIGTLKAPPAVGVLPFAVQIGEKPQYGVGPLNSWLADRLETALALALDPAEPEVCLLKKASDTILASNDPKATHLTEEGREHLFKLKYQPHWDDGSGAGKERRADALLSGIATIDVKRGLVQLSITAYRRKGEPLAALPTFDALLDLRTLGEAGLPFVPRGPVFIPDPEETKPNPLLVATPVPPDPRDIPDPDALANSLKTSPVQLTIWYKDRRTGEKREAKLGYHDRIDEPRDNEQVIFTLRNTKDKEYGVVLRVNGENTLFRQFDDPLNQRAPMWIIEGGKDVNIVGFYESEGNSPEFKVATTTESKQWERRYKEPGTITFLVYEVAKRKKASEPTRYGTAAADADARLVRLGRAVRTGADWQAASSPEAMQNRLRDLPNQKRRDELPARGIIIRGAESGQQVREVEYNRSDRPVRMVTLRYYDPVGGE
jgi:hypothetical protein